jgi:hypothetical protein
MPLAMKTMALWRDKENSHGIETVKDARVIPMPSVINKAGNAQQIRVPVEVNKERIVKN